MDPMKGYNFRFTTKEIGDLDSLVLHFSTKGNYFDHWSLGTRTSVLKKLIKDKIVEIDEAARKAAGLDDAKNTTKPKPKKGKKKCPTKEPSATSSRSLKSAKPTTR